MAAGRPSATAVSYRALSENHTHERDAGVSVHRAAFLEIGRYRAVPMHGGSFMGVGCCFSVVLLAELPTLLRVHSSQQ